MRHAGLSPRRKQWGYRNAITQVASRAAGWGSQRETHRRRVALTLFCSSKLLVLRVVTGTPTAWETHGRAFFSAMRLPNEAELRKGELSKSSDRNPRPRRRAARFVEGLLAG